MKLNQWISSLSVWGGSGGECSGLLVLATLVRSAVHYRRVSLRGLASVEGLMIIYLIGSLRNPEVPKAAQVLRGWGHEVFDEWYSAGPIADDCWKAHQSAKGLSFIEALKGYAAQHIYDFDLHHIKRADIGILLLPAGNSGHLELGYLIGTNKPGYVILPPNEKQLKLSPDWKWVAGLFEGEGSITASFDKHQNRFYPKLTIGTTDKDVLEKLVKIVGFGKFHGPYKRKSNSFGKKPIYFFQLGDIEQVTYFLRGVWSDLLARRRQQVMTTFSKIGLGDDFKYQGKPPYDFRWDVMYNFATAVVETAEELKEVIP